MRSNTLLLGFFTSALLMLGCSPPTKGMAKYAPEFATPAAIQIPVQRFQYPNGLTLLVNEDHSSPLVAVSMLYRAGSAREEPGQYGLAHFVEHLMFDGSKHAPASDWLETLYGAGAFDVNAFTTQDMTLYHETMPRGALELALWMESERMAFHEPAMTQDVFDRERRVVKNELYERTEGALGLASKYITEALFPEGHPYRHMTIGTVADLDSLTLAQERAFVQKYYTPRNATLMLVGDVRAADADALVKRYFGDIPPGEPVPPLDFPPVLLQKERRIVIEADIGRAMAFVAWPLPAGYAPGIAELRLGRSIGMLAPSLEWDTALRGVIVDENALAGIMMIYGAGGPGKSATDALDDIDSHLHHVRAQSWRWDRIKFAIGRTTILTDTVLGMESFGTRAVTMSQDEFYAADPSYVGTWLKTYLETGPRDVQDAAYQFLPFDGRVVALINPKKGAPRGGRLVSAR